MLDLYDIKNILFILCVCMRVGTCPHMSQCVCRLEDSLQNSHHMSHGIELRLSGLVRGAVTHWAILTTLVWHFKGKQHSLHCETSCSKDELSEAWTLAHYTGVPSVPAQFADPPLVKCWQLLLSFFLYTRQRRRMNTSAMTQGWKCFLSPKRATWVIWESGA